MIVGSVIRLKLSWFPSYLHGLPIPLDHIIPSIFVEMGAPKPPLHLHPSHPLSLSPQETTASWKQQESKEKKQKKKKKKVKEKDKKKTFSSPIQSPSQIPRPLHQFLILMLLHLQFPLSLRADELNSPLLFALRPRVFVVELAHAHTLQERLSAWHGDILDGCVVLRREVDGRRGGSGDG